MSRGTSVKRGTTESKNWGVAAYKLRLLAKQIDDLSDDNSATGLNTLKGDKARMMEIFTMADRAEQITYSLGVAYHKLYGTAIRERRKKWAGEK